MGVQKQLLTTVSIIDKPGPEVLYVVFPQNQGHYCF